MLITDNRDLLLDSRNSLVIQNGDLAWSRGIPGVMQDCRIKLSMFKGEWFLDTTKGISYWQEILGKKPDVAIAAITSEFYSKLISVEDVEVVRKLDITYSGRTRGLTVIWSVKCTFGNTPDAILTIPV